MDAARLREAVAAEYKIIPYRQYGEKQAAEFWDVDVSTAKRWRREGLVPFIEMPNRGIKYFGFQIIDVLIFGKEAQKGHGGGGSPSLGPSPGDEFGNGTVWPSTRDDRSSVENGTSVGDEIPQPGTEPGTMPRPEAPNALASAQLTKLLRKNG